MEKGERFEKGGPGGKVNVGRWKDRWKGWMFEGKERTKRERRQKKFNGDGGPLRKKEENLKVKVGWKRVRDLRKGGWGKVGRWKDFFSAGKTKKHYRQQLAPEYKACASTPKAYSSLQQSRQDLWFPLLPFQRFQAFLTLFPKSFSFFPHGKVGGRRDEVEGWERGAGALRGGVRGSIATRDETERCVRVGLVAEQDPQVKVSKWRFLQCSEGSQNCTVLFLTGFEQRLPSNIPKRRFPSKGIQVKWRFLWGQVKVPR